MTGDWMNCVALIKISYSSDTQSLPPSRIVTKYVLEPNCNRGNAIHEAGHYDGKYNCYFALFFIEDWFKADSEDSLKLDFVCLILLC